MHCNYTGQEKIKPSFTGKGVTDIAIIRIMILRKVS